MPELLTDYGAWQVHQLRLTVFPISQTSTGRAPGLWEAAMGREPDNIDFRLKEKLTIEQGMDENIHLQVITRRDRIDWILQSQPPLRNGGYPKIVPVIRDLAAADRSIRNAVVASRKFVAQVNRIAFVITLIEISSDLDDAIGRLSPYLPDLRLGNAGEDFSYQVNRRRGSKAIPRIRINRLAKWSIFQFGSINLDVRPAARPVFDVSEVTFTARLDLDINNVPSGSAISQKKIPALIGELAEMASEIALKGDID